MDEKKKGSMVSRHIASLEQMEGEAVGGAVDVVRGDARRQGQGRKGTVLAG